MSDIPYINQSEDLDFELTVKKPDGTALDMSTAGTRVYLLLYDGYGNAIAKFKSGGAASGWYIIDSSNFATGVLSFSLLTEVTKTLSPGKYYLEVKVRYPSSIHTDDGYYDVGKTELCFGIRESQISKITSLP